MKETITHSAWLKFETMMIILYAFLIFAAVFAANNESPGVVIVKFIVAVLFCVAFHIMVRNEFKIEMEKVEHCDYDYIENGEKRKHETVIVKKNAVREHGA
jgi:hypothetical protein